MITLCQKRSVSNSVSYDQLPRESLLVTLVERDRKLVEKEAEIDKLHRLLIQAKKNLYGSKSEKLSDLNQEELFSFAQATEEISEENAPIPAVEIEGYTRRARTKRELPEDIERERIEYDLASPTCSGCSLEMPVIGEEVSEELEFIPARFKVLEHVRLKRACPSCKNGVFVPALPPEVKPLERRAAGAGLLAQICISKYQDHQPLYRQEEIFKRHGINLPRKLLCGWVAGAAELLLPLYEAQKRELLQETYLQADETTLKVQDSERQGSLHTGYLWAMLSPSKKVLFHYAESRAGSVPLELFQGFQGRLQTDAYAGYNQVFLPESCERIACLAHIRRKFIEAQGSSNKSDTQKIFIAIADLYKIERELKNKPPDVREATRKRKSFPYLKKLYRILKEQRRRTLPQSEYAKVLNYAWGQRVAMLRFLRDGRYELDNNLIENQMRPVALGRKNYLFAGSHDGARRAAVLYSMINSCKLNGINAFEYLSDVFRRVHTPGIKVEELLPHNWKKSQTMGKA